jgi:hypothetical protein
MSKVCGATTAHDGVITGGIHAGAELIKRLIFHAKGLASGGAQDAAV